MVIPVHDVNPLRRVPWMTYALVAANVVVFLVTPGISASISGSTTLRQECRQLAFYDHYAAIPTELTHDKALRVVATGSAQRVGAHRGCAVGRPGYDKVPFLSAVTSQFVHGGWLHLLGNMLFLIIFGNNVEDRIGRVKYLLFYVSAGVIAAYGFALANADSRQPLIGASGAIAGLLGAYLVMFPRAKVWSLIPFFFFIPVRLPAWLVLGGWFLIQWAYASGAAVSSAGAVAYLSHVVGFGFGLLVGLVIRRVQGPAQPPTTRWRRPAW
ncbi:MAG TPA: rhomboid family intramembrane serine protease [Jatrophihabitans sp.]|nr:rhomboid family intramembrane serine protease [Jatrophihabitans sp.]